MTGVIELGHGVESGMTGVSMGMGSAIDSCRLGLPKTGEPTPPVDIRQVANELTTP